MHKALQHTWREWRFCNKLENDFSGLYKFKWNCRFIMIWIKFVWWCLTSLSTIFQFYLTFCTFSFQLKESSLSDTRCLIQDVWCKVSDTRCCITTLTVMIKEWRDVARDLLCRTILSWCHIIGMRGKTRQCEQH